MKIFTKLHFIKQSNVNENIPKTPVYVKSTMYMIYYGGVSVAKSCTTLVMDCSQPGSSVYGISQTRILIYSTMCAAC